MSVPEKGKHIIAIASVSCCLLLLCVGTGTVFGLPHSRLDISNRFKLVAEGKQKTATGAIVGWAEIKTQLSSTGDANAAKINCDKIATNGIKESCHETIPFFLGAITKFDKTKDDFWTRLEKIVQYYVEAKATVSTVTDGSCGANVAYTTLTELVHKIYTGSVRTDIAYNIQTLKDLTGIVAEADQFEGIVDYIAYLLYHWTTIEQKYIVEANDLVQTMTTFAKAFGKQIEDAVGHIESDKFALTEIACDVQTERKDDKRFKGKDILDTILAAGDITLVNEKDSTNTKVLKVKDYSYEFFHVIGKKCSCAAVGERLSMNVATDNRGTVFGCLIAELYGGDKQLSLDMKTFFLFAPNHEAAAKSQFRLTDSIIIYTCHENYAAVVVAVKKCLNGKVGTGSLHMMEPVKDNTNTVIPGVFTGDEYPGGKESFGSARAKSFAQAATFYRDVPLGDEEAIYRVLVNAALKKLKIDPCNPARNLVDHGFVETGSEVKVETKTIDGTDPKYESLISDFDPKNWGNPLDKLVAFDGATELPKGQQHVDYVNPAKVGATFFFT